MLTFNDLLALEGLESTRVRLVRHQDGRLRPGKMYETWRSDRAAFEAYQRVQSRDVFPVGHLLASFIVTEAGKSVFVGMYRVAGRGACPPASVDALIGHDVSGQIEYDLRLVEHLADYREKSSSSGAQEREAGFNEPRNKPKPSSRSPSRTSPDSQAFASSSAPSAT